MQFRVDPTGPASPSEQLSDQVRSAIASGRQAEGGRLPSLRVLASEVGVNPNTIGRAWRDLEREGILKSRRGDGMYVAPGARDRCRRLVARSASERLGRAIAHARSGGLDCQAVRDLVELSLAAWDQALSTEEER